MAINEDGLPTAGEQYVRALKTIERQTTEIERLRTVYRNQDEEVRRLRRVAEAVREYAEELGVLEPSPEQWAAYEAKWQGIVQRVVELSAEAEEE